jgi:hypothetical protein
MGISLNPVEVLKFFKERGVRDKQAVADYLERIAGVAGGVAERWTIALSKWQQLDLLSGKNGGLPSWQEIWLNEIEGRQQLSLLLEAAEHYQRASSVLAGRLSKSEMDDLFIYLGGLLESRSRAKELYDLEIESSRESQFSLDNVKFRLPLQTIKEMVEAMQGQAAALRALAVAVRYRR